MNAFERAQALRSELEENRRYLHTNAEVGLDLPKARAYVMEKLTEYGLEPHLCGHGVTATLGKGGKTLLLRADMDALPMGEESGLSFACPTGQQAHCCGHDLHAAMLLTAAKLLKEQESELKGTVRFMFQPAEETFQGAQDMIDNGILDPLPDAALAYHVGSGRMPVGLYMFNNTPKAAVMFSMDQFVITVKGKGSHGAYPQLSVDPINIGVHIHLALQELIARESDPMKSCVLTVGKFQGGTAYNIIPETCVLGGTIRSNDKDARNLLVRRVEEVAKSVAAVYGGSAEVDIFGVPPLVCDHNLINEFSGYMQELPIPGLTPYPGVSASASEDFALVAEKVPSAFIYLSAGYLDERGDAPAHNPKVQFNEDVLPIGAASLAHCAQRWLENHQ